MALFITRNSMCVESIDSRYEAFFKWCILPDITEAYSEPCQISRMERFAEIFNGQKPLIVFAKRSILDSVQSAAENGKFEQAWCGGTTYFLKVVLKGINLVAFICFGVFRISYPPPIPSDATPGIFMKVKIDANKWVRWRSSSLTQIILIIQTSEFKHYSQKIYFSLESEWKWQHTTNIWNGILGTCQ